MGSGVSTFGTRFARGAVRTPGRAQHRWGQLQSDDGPVGIRPCGPSGRTGATRSTTTLAAKPINTRTAEDDHG